MVGGVRYTELVLEEEAAEGGEAPDGGTWSSHRFFPAGGVDDAWADGEDVTEEDCALRSVPVAFSSLRSGDVDKRLRPRTGRTRKLAGCMLPTPCNLKRETPSILCKGSVLHRQAWNDGRGTESMALPPWGMTNTSQLHFGPREVALTCPGLP